MTNEERERQVLAVQALLPPDHHIERWLGDGGFARVFKVRVSGITEKLFAFKVLEKRSPDATARFRQEYLGLTELGHPNVVKVHRHGELSDGRRYIVMEYLEGETLFAFIRAGKTSLPRTFDLVAQMGAGLRAAHAFGIVHRDLKPENVFLIDNPNGRKQVKILDFGIASFPDHRHTNVNDRAGTALYMSPEQFESMTHTDPRSDIYSLGVVFYEMVFGRPPFTGRNFEVLEFEHTKGRLSIAAEWRAASPLHERVAEVLEKALAKDPMARYQDMSAFVAAVEGLQSL